MFGCLAGLYESRAKVSFVLLLSVGYIDAHAKCMMLSLRRYGSIEMMRYDKARLYMLFEKKNLS